MENSGELSGKFCSKLGTNVMVVSKTDENGTVQRQCLSSHLCRSDGGMRCDMAKIEKENKINNIIN